MLRLLGGGMILTGCLGLGVWYRQQFILRLKAIRIMVEILEILMSEIGYGKAKHRCFAELVPKCTATR